MKKRIVMLSVATASIFYACDRTTKMPEQSTADTAVVTENKGDTIVHPMGDDWDIVKLDLPDVKFPEVNLPDLKLRGNDEYTAYSLGENILFDSDKAEIKADAKEELEQISASIQQRYADGKVRIYGYTDSLDTKGHNKELAEKRAEAVKQWLVTNGKIAEDRISIHPLGEKNPVRTNATAEGREQNRRVEIVARKKS